MIDQSQYIYEYNQTYSYLPFLLDTHSLKTKYIFVVSPNLN